MTAIRHALLLSVLALPLAAGAADKTKTDPTGCDNVNWSKDVLDAFPNAKRGCQRVTIKNDEVYAQYEAEVVKVDSEGVTVHFKDHDGKDMSKAKLAPDEDMMVRVNDQDIKFRKIEKGTDIHFYIPRNRWGLYTTPGGKPIKIISSEVL